MGEKLTPRQERFVQAVVDGAPSYAAAGREAGYSASTEPSRAASDRVRTEIARRRAERMGNPRAIRDRALGQVNAALDQENPDYALKAAHVMTGVLKEAGDEPEPMDVRAAEREVGDVYRRLTYNAIRYALDSPHRAAQLMMTLGARLGYVQSTVNAEFMGVADHESATIEVADRGPGGDEPAAPETDR